VRTLYELRQPSDIRIWYIIGGTAQEPTFSYESDPLMETGDIISYTLFGRPLNALSGWQQSVAGRSDGGVGDAAVEILLDRVEQLASQALGIDVLTIDNTRIGGQSGTTIKAGKFISDRIFVALIQELGATVSSQVLLEYQIRRNLDIIVTGSDNNRNGLEIQWKLDY
jgi:autotransporter translocation and assembly factor TamB